jgi:hypothetical protein
MKKIFFNDKFGLTQAVLDGCKTMTRRIVPFTYCKDKIHLSRYKVGEVVAIAQKYRDVEQEGYPVDSRYDAFRTANWGNGEDGALKSSSGWNNKLFVRADFMPHHIRITDLKVERLQDISDEDCFKEGIYASNSHEIGYGIPWVYEYKKSKMAYYTPREAFADLIDKVSGKGTWESNPYVFVYEFELID